MAHRILLVEDDPAIRQPPTIGLNAAGYEVIAAADGRDALDRFAADGPDAVVLDIMLPVLDGLAVCRTIRLGSAVPIIMLTARTDAFDVVAGLEAGADDYVRKPFELPELVARLRVALRRAGSTESGGPLRLGPLEIDEASHAVRRDDEEIPLSHTEFRLLAEMARRPGQVFTRELLLEQIWGYDYLGDSRLVDVAIQRLRAKVEAEPSRPELILTVRGVGYKARK